MQEQERPTLITSLQNAAAYPHAVHACRVLETHISWVILTGVYAYKIKKPVDFGFLDFSTLEQRRHACQEELRLNRRFAPELYLDVLPITGTSTQPLVGGAGAAIEYCVRMIEFAQDALLDALLQRGSLAPGDIDLLAREVSAFHATAERAHPDSPFGTPGRVHAPVRENFAQILPLLADDEDVRCMRRLEDWCEAKYHEHSSALAARRREGFIRECHGDLHLGNMVKFAGRIVPFDCIEFNPGLRWIDVMSDVAFVAMDLEDRNHPRYARRFLNVYLEETGDYAGVVLLPYYQAYRSLVRAKIAALRMGQQPRGTGEHLRSLGNFREYAALAERLTVPSTPMLLITHGLSGSGKTTGALQLAEGMGAIRIRSDIERRRLFPHRSEGLGIGRYAAPANEATYARLADLVRQLLSVGRAVIVDASFLDEARRSQFRRLAADQRVFFSILSFQAPVELLRSRIEARAQTEADASEATRAVLEYQIRARQPLTPSEIEITVTVDTGETADLERVQRELTRRAGDDQ